MYEKEKSELQKKIEKNEEKIEFFNKRINFKALLIMITSAVSITLGIIASPLFEWMFVGPLAGLTVALCAGTAFGYGIINDLSIINNAKHRIEQAKHELQLYSNDQNRQQEKLNIKTVSSSNNYSFKNGKSNEELARSERELGDKFLDAVANLYGSNMTNDKDDRNNDSGRGRK